jgi:hypothetical protein
MKKILFYIACVALLSCNKATAPDIFKTTGEITTEARTVGFFDKLYVDDQVNVIIHHDTTQYVEVEAGKNLLPKIKTEIDGSTLRLYNENKWNFMRSYKYEITVHVHTDTLRYINFVGGGDISSANTLQFPVLKIETEGGSSDVLFNIDADSLFLIFHTGVGNTYINGQCNYAYFYSVGNTIFHNENLVVNHVHCNNGSTGDFFVHALNTLHVEVRSIANTWYRGNPSLSTVVTGSGEVKTLP